MNDVLKVIFKKVQERVKWAYSSQDANQPAPAVETPKAKTRTKKGPTA